MEYRNVLQRHVSLTVNNVHSVLMLWSIAEPSARESSVQSRVRDNTILHS